MAHAFFGPVLVQAQVCQLLSDAHCSVESTPIEVWAGQEGFMRRPKSLAENSMSCA
jgi:hypothetical protein